MIAIRLVYFAYGILVAFIIDKGYQKYKVIQRNNKKQKSIEEAKVNIMAFAYSDDAVENEE